MNLPQTSLSDSAPIFLVGFMGAGKTTVGRALAHNLEYNFFDLDELICAGVGKSVSEIFSELGEAEFRKIESEAIQSCRGLGRTVIALGGGAYVSEGNRALLREIGKTVWLDCPLEVCLSRIAGDKLRPLLGDQEEMRDLLAQRRAAYALADFTVQAAGFSPEDLAMKIINIVS